MASALASMVEGDPDSLASTREAASAAGHPVREILVPECDGIALISAVDKVCAAIVGDNDQYLVATVGLAENGPRQRIRLLSAAGKASAYLDGLDLSWSESVPEGRGPAGRAIRSGQPFIVREADDEAVFSPWRERARPFGIRSSVTVPFHCDDGGAGIVMVYAAQPDAFGEREVDLLLKHVREIAFALSLEKARAQLEAAEAARRTAEEAARESQVELARAARALSVGVFAASLAHEVNQPIAAIVTSGGAALNWLGADPPRLDKVRDCVERMARDATRTSEIVRSTRAMLSGQARAPELVDLRQLLRETLQFVQTSLKRAEVRTKTCLGQTVPPVLADRVQLQQVAINLIVNAIDAMKMVTGRERVLTVACRVADDGRVMVCVTDNGIGLPPDATERVFDHLFTTKPDGMGLGLAVSKSIIEAHDGEIKASPNAPHGAVFSFLLPPSRTD